jgi:hypothetical protein
MKILRRLPPFETLLVVAAVVLLGILATLRQSAQETRRDAYSSYDAGPAGYRAWYEVLVREGVRVERFERLPAFLDAGTGTLIWAAPPAAAGNAPALNAADARALADWVRDGGSLVLLGPAGAISAGLKLPVDRAARPVRDARFAATLRAQGIDAVAWAAAPPRYASRRSDEMLARDRTGVLALRYRLGRGTIVAVVDASPVTNARLGLLDGGRFAFGLARPARPATRVAFAEAMHGYYVPEHWWQIVPLPFALGVLGAAFVLLVAFAGSAVRLGPPIVPPSLREPTSFEFLDSVAGLLERGRGAKAAVADAVRSTKRVVAGAVGLPDDAPNQALAARIETPALRADFTALVAFERLPAPDDSTVLRAVVLAQRLRKEYASHAGSRR